MSIVTFIVAVVALIISILAYWRAGGAKELKKTVDSLSSTMESLKERAGGGLKEQVEHLTSVTESLREKTADIIDRVEKSVRREAGEKPREQTHPREKPGEEKTPEQKPSVPKTPRQKRE